jgi:hypothetical protein
MPPQQGDALLDFFDNGFDFSAQFRAFHENARTIVSGPRGVKGGRA